MSTQVWPSPDDFADGATAYGTGVRRYLRVRPTDDVGDITGVSGGLSITPSVLGGELRRYWFNELSEPSPNSAEYAAGFHNYGASIQNSVAAVVERQTYIADGEVTITPRVYSISGEQDHLIQHCVGVCGRVQGGSLAIPTTAVEEYVNLPNGYYFLQVRDLSQTAEPELVLFRVVSGGWIQLAAALLSAHESYIWGVLDGGAPRRMRMVVEDEGEGVRIRCYRVRKNSGPTASGTLTAPSEQLVFSYWDSNASAITTAGRWGVVGCQPADQSGSAGVYRGTVLIASLRIRDAAGTAVYLRDYWHRTTSWVGHVNNDDASTLAIKSRTLSMAYSGDMCGPFESQPLAGVDHGALAHVGHLIADAGNNRLILGVDPEVAYPSGGVSAFDQTVGWYFSQDPAPSSDQHRSVTMTFLSTATSPRESRVFGLHLRAMPEAWYDSVLAGKHTAFADYDDDPHQFDCRKGGYRATVSYEHLSGTTDTFTVKVWHHEPGPFPATSVLLATADVTATLTLGTEFKLGLEVHDFDFGGGPGVGVLVKLNNAAVTLVLESLTGVTIESGWLVDRRTVATTEGLTVGMYGNIHPSHLAAGLIHINQYATEALTPGIGPHTPPLAHDDGTAVGAGANNGELFVTPGGTAFITVLANDEAFDGATIDDTSVTLNFQPKINGSNTNHGSSTVDGLTGVVTYNCPAGSTEEGVFWRYRFQDDLGTDSSNSGLIRVTIVAGTPPVAVDDLATVVSGAAVPITVLDNDQLDGGASWQAPNPVEIITQAPNGTAVADSSGEVTFTSDPGAAAQDEEFTYQATDSNGLTSNIATVTVEVTGASGPPIAVNDTGIEVDSGQSIDIDILANDVAVSFPIDPATVVITGGLLLGTAIPYTSGLNVGEVAYTAPDIPSNEIDWFFYRVSDEDTPASQSNQAGAFISITGTGETSPPTANPDSMSVVVGATATHQLTLNDDPPPGGEINHESIVITLTPAFGTVNVLTGGFVEFVSGALDPSPSTEFFQYTVDSTFGNTSDPALVIVTVNAGGPGQKPDAIQDDAVVVAEETVEIDVVANDVAYNGDAIDPTTVTIVTGPTTGTVGSPNATTGVIAYTAAASDITTSDSFTYEVSDDATTPLTSDPGTVFITITGTGTPPQNPDAGNDYAQIISGQSTLVSILANDLAFNGATLNPASVMLDTSGLDPLHATATYSAATELVTFTSVPNAPAGVESFTYTVEDSNGWISNTATVTVVVTDGGPPPPGWQDSIDVDAETVAKTGTLTTPASWPIKEDRVIGIYSSRFDTGHRSTIPALPKYRRLFGINMGGATSAERETMSAFFLSHRGTEIPFDWVHPLTDETIAVRFSSANTAAKHISGVGSGVEDYRFDLVEVFGASIYGGGSA